MEKLIVKNVNDLIKSMLNQPRLFDTKEIAPIVGKMVIDETSAWSEVQLLVKEFPSEEDELLPGIKWGNYTQLYTPAFWKLQYVLSNFENSVTYHRLASTIVEEIVMCILGGYGIPSEMGIVAFQRLKEQNIITSDTNLEAIHTALAEPFLLANGKSVRYRFHNQKSRYICNLLKRNDLETIPQRNDIALRTWLLSVDGIGLKTASWITRNWLNSNRVAILDIHLLRAGKLTGFFDSDVLTDYLLLEKKYLSFCKALKVEASNMDALIWRYMKNNSRLAIRSLFNNH